jgi:hypothetical protein
VTAPSDARKVDGEVRGCADVEDASGAVDVNFGLPVRQVVHTVEVDTIVIRSSTETRHVDLVRVDNFRRLAEPASARSAERSLNGNRFRWRAPRSAGRARVHGQIDAIDLRRANNTHVVDMITQCGLGAPFPAPVGSRSAYELGLPCVPPVQLNNSRVEVAEWAELPNYVVALTAVPDAGARQYGTSPFRQGARATAGGPVPAWEGNDQRETGSESAVPVISGIGRWALARCRRTDGSSGPRSAVSGAHGRADRSCRHPSAPETGDHIVRVAARSASASPRRRWCAFRIDHLRDARFH